MFKKWRITGLNKALAFVLALLLALGLPAAAAKPADFTDLDPEAWYYREVSGAIDAGLFAGVSETLFDVAGTINRAQFVTALARLCKANTAGYSTDRFTDVQPEHWFYREVSWAYAMGITNGTGEDTFSPGAPITRQEMCKMLGIAIEQVFGVAMSGEGAADFADRADIAPWAAEWVDKCNVIGIFLGDENGFFNPQAPAIRAQAAAVFYRCHANPALQPPVSGEYTLSVSGFELDFDVDTDYYLARPADFENCRINGFTGFKSLTVSVEQYASYYPYKNTAYKWGDALKLGHGRAKVTLTATLQNGTTREYLIALTDPNAADYAYARARVNGTVNLRAEPTTNSESLALLVNNARVYYLKTEGNWCMVEQLTTGKVGYIHKDYLRWEWLATEMPESYAEKIAALQAAHPNWTFEFVDVEMTMAEALAEYGAANAQYIDPLNYLAEDKIFAFLNIDVYDQETWQNPATGISAMWVNESAFSKAQAAEYFIAAGESLNMNPYYITCRAILESGYGTSKFAKGTVSGYEGYYNFFGIQCYDSDPTVGAVYAKNRNWNSVFRSIVEGANWVKDQYLDQGAVTPYFFRFAGFQNKVYMSDVQAPLKEASILKKAFADPNAKAHFVIPVYR